MSEDNTPILGFESTEQLLSFNRQIAAEFRANEGRCGGPLEGNPMVLVTMTGARSGRQLTTPLSYYADGDDCIVMASAGGSPRHPQWFFNLVANPDVTVERGGETYEASALLTSGTDRTDAYNQMVEALPRFGEYQAGTDREIPIFRIVRRQATATQQADG